VLSVPMDERITIEVLTATRRRELTVAAGEPGPIELRLPRVGADVADPAWSPR